MKKIYILFALLLMVMLFAGCKKHDKEVFTSDSLEYLSSLAQISSNQETVNPTPSPNTSVVGGTTQQDVTSSQYTSTENSGSSQTNLPAGSKPATGAQTSSDPLDLPVTGDNEISADEFDKPDVSSNPESSSSQPEEAPEETVPPAETPSEEPSSSSRPEIAPVSSDKQQWSPYF